MDLNKKKGVVVGIIVIVVLLYSFGGNITGNVVRDLVDVDNCSDYNIGVLWDNVFDVDDSNLVIIKENVVGGDMCEKYVAYKNDSDGQVWVLYESFYDNFWVGVPLRYSDGKKILNETVLAAFYLDVNESFFDSYTFANDIEGVVGVIGDVPDDDLIDWSVINVVEAENKVNSILDFDILESTFVEYDDFFGFGESIEETWLDFSYGVSVSKNESFVLIDDYVITNYDPSFVVSFTGDVPDYEFDMNSSWNSAFNVSDYFDVSDGIEVSFSSIGDNNTGGVWIDSLVVDGVVNFKPAVDFTGSREFVLMADNPAGANVFSNAFNVTISIPNDAPVLTRDFNNIGVPGDSGVNIFLGLYFEDPDDDAMTYGAIRDGDLNITIDDDMMTIRLGPDFNYTSKVRVFADDGIDRTRGNYFYVYALGDLVSMALAENLANNDTIGLVGVVDNDTVAGDVVNTSESSAGGGVEDGVNWVLWIFVIVAVLLLVLFFIWVFILKRGESGVVSSAPPKPAISFVNNYLSGLNLPKK